MPGLKRAVSFELDQPDSVPWYAVTTWTEADTSDFYCIEPWIGLPDAIHNGHGLRWLAPGQDGSGVAAARGLRARLTLRAPLDEPAAGRFSRRDMAKTLKSDVWTAAHLSLAAALREV